MSEVIQNGSFVEGFMFLKPRGEGQTLQGRSLLGEKGWGNGELPGAVLPRKIACIFMVVFT